jgi:hypothetical protein
VVIGYVRPSLDPPAHPLMPLSVTDAITQVLVHNTVGPIPNVPSPSGYIDKWPLARGTYTTQEDPGWVYFRTDGKSTAPYLCGIGPNGSVAGCDVESPPDGAPAGTNQIVLDSSGPRHLHSATTTFTRARAGVDVVRIGERVENGPAACTVTDQAPVACRIGENGSVSHGVFK